VLLHLILAELISRKHPNLSCDSYCTRNDFLIGVGIFNYNHHCLVQREMDCFCDAFAMGIKLFGNKISQSTDEQPFNRTFTDLGIELSQLFYKKPKKTKN
jgi:hypothetical protein